MGSVAKSYMKKGFLICEEMCKYLTIYEEAVSPIWLCSQSLLNFLIYDEILIFFFISEGELQFIAEFKSAEKFYLKCTKHKL